MSNVLGNIKRKLAPETDITPTPYTQTNTYTARVPDFVHTKTDLYALKFTQKILSLPDKMLILR